MSQAHDGLAARRAALAAIRAVEEDGTWSNLAVPAAVADLPTARDRAFASHLAYDTLRWRDTLDHALAQASARPLDDMRHGGRSDRGPIRGRIPHRAPCVPDRSHHAGRGLS